MQSASSPSAPVAERMAAAAERIASTAERAERGAAERVARSARTTALAEAAATLLNGPPRSNPTCMSLSHTFCPHLLMSNLEG